MLDCVITKVILFPLTFVRFLMEKRGKLQQCSFALHTEHDLVVEKGYEPAWGAFGYMWLLRATFRRGRGIWGAVASMVWPGRAWYSGSFFLLGWCGVPEFVAFPQRYWVPVGFSACLDGQPVASGEAFRWNKVIRAWWPRNPYGGVFLCWHVRNRSSIACQNYFSLFWECWWFFQLACVFLQAYF